MADEENDVVEVDAATKYIVRHGDIHASKAAIGNIERYWEDAIEFFSAISSNAPLTHMLSEEPFVVPGSSPEVTSRSFVIAYKYGPGLKIRMYNQEGDSTTKIPKFHFRIEIGQYNYIDLTGILTPSEKQSPSLFHWALYKSNYAVTDSGGATIASASDLGVSVVFDARNPPPEATDQQILNLMAKHTRFAFCIVEAIDSIRNEVVPAILIPQCPNLTWAPYGDSEIGKRIASSVDLRTGLSWPVSDQSPGILASVLITPDSMYYPPKSGQNSSRRAIKSSPVAAIQQIAPVWSQISRCVTPYTLGLVYGGQLPAEDVQNPNLYFSGPRYTQLGSRYFLRCCDLYMSVVPIETDNSN